jgi:hypothetical protein
MVVKRICVDRLSKVRCGKRGLPEESRRRSGHQRLYRHSDDFRVISQTLMFLLASIEATLGIKSMLGDAFRAYLNAPSLDKNLVVIADSVMTGGEGMERLSKESVLIKGLYGSTKGALSFQVWADMKLGVISVTKSAMWQEGST